MTLTYEPKWKSYIATTTGPMFSPAQCRQVIEKGRSLKPQKARVGAVKKGGELSLIHI